jgi:hypothetical protein
VTVDIQDALEALDGLFGKDLYLAKSDTCMAAFKALKEATTTQQKLTALGKCVREWIDRSAAAIRLWTPKYAALADAAGFAGKDKWGWIKENVTEKLQRSCTGPEFPGSWGGPITSWEPLEWWIRNACNEAPSFLILRDEPLILPQWLRISTNPVSDPIGYYRMIQRAELGRELEWALDHAKIEAATSSTQSNLRISQEQITDSRHRKLPKKTWPPRVTWPPRSFSPGFPGVREQLVRAFRTLTKSGFLIDSDPQNDLGDGKTWVVECRSTDKLPKDTDLADLARQCLESKGIVTDGVSLEGRTLYVTLSPPARQIAPSEQQSGPALAESERERLRAKRLRENYGINIDGPPIRSRSAIIKEYMEAHNGEQPPEEYVVGETLESVRQSLGMKKAQSDLPVDVEPIAPGHQEPCFTASLDYRSIRFNGVTHTLTRNQGTIIKILHEAFERGTPSIGKSKLLAAVESESSRVQDFFRHSPLWKTLVVSGERRGTYRLNLPARG